MSNGLTGKKTSKLKFILYFVGAFLCLCLIVILSLPTLLSTNAGKKIVVNAINNKTGVKVEIDSLSLSWFGSQSAEGIRAQQPEDQLSFTCQALTTDASLWKIGFGGDMGNLKISAPDLQMSKPFQPAAHARQNPLQAAGFAAAPQVDFGFSEIDLFMRGQVTIERGKIGFNPPGLDPITFDQIAMTIDMSQKNQIAFSMNCATTQNQNQGQISIKGSGSQLDQSFPLLSVDASISKMPMRGVDQLISVAYPQFNGLLVSAIGNTMDLNCNFRSSEGNIDLNLDAQSSQLTAQIATQSANGILSLKTPGVLNFNMTPALLPRLAKLIPSLSQLTLNQPSLLQITLVQFSCPVQQNLSHASFKATVQAPPQLFLTLNGNPLVLNKLTLQTDSNNAGERINVHAATELQTQGQLGSFALDGFILPLSNSGNFTVAAEKFPVDLIGTFVPTPVPFSTLLGSSADLNSTLDLATENPKLHLSWKSALLNIPAVDIALSDNWTLTTPASFSYALTPDLFNALFPDKKIQLANADLLQGSLKNLVIHPNNLKNTYLNATVSAGQIALGGDLPLVISKLQASLAINNLDQIAVQIDSDPIKASLSGSLNLDTQEFALNKPLIVQCTVNNALLQNINPSAPQLVQPATFLLSLDPMAFPIGGLALDKLKAKGQLSTSLLALATGTKQISLQNFTVPFQWDGKNKTASLQLSSQVQNASGESGSMQGQFNLTNMSLEKELYLSRAVINGALELQNISSAFLDAFSGKSLSAVTGPSFSSKVKLQSSIDRQNLSMKWTSPYLNVDSAFAIDNASIQLQGSNNQITWTLTPDGYKALDAMLTGPTKGMVPFEIKDTSTFTLTLNKLQLPVTPKTAIASLADRVPDVVFDLNALQLALSGNNPKLTFFDKSSQEMIQLSAMTFSLNKNAAQAPLNVAFDSSIITQGTTNGSTQGAKSGSISLAGRLEPTLAPDGTFDLSKLTAGLELKVQQLPSRALDIVARAKGRTDFPFTTVFGNLINATLSLDLKSFNGPVSLNLNSPMTRASLT